MVLSKTGVLFGILIFFTLLSTFVGLYESSNQQSLAITGETEITQGSSYGFFKNIIKGYADLPVAFNLILFGTLGTTLLWIAVTTFVPTLNGGS